MHRGQSSLWVLVGVLVLVILVLWWRRKHRDRCRLD
jgi:LPXTG-motif cell wall-anchored protein